MKQKRHTTVRFLTIMMLSMCMYSTVQPLNAPILLEEFFSFLRSPGEYLNESLHTYFLDAQYKKSIKNPTAQLAAESASRVVAGIPCERLDGYWNGYNVKDAETSLKEEENQGNKFKEKWPKMNFKQIILYNAIQGSKEGESKDGKDKCIDNIQRCRVLQSSLSEAKNNLSKAKEYATFTGLLKKSVTHEVFRRTLDFVGTMISQTKSMQKLAKQFKRGTWAHLFAKEFLDLGIYYGFAYCINF